MAILILVLNFVPVSAQAQVLPPEASDVKVAMDFPFNQAPPVKRLHIPTMLGMAALDSVTSQPTTLVEWQRQYDDATRRRDGGNRKIKISYLLLGGGLIMFAAGVAGAEDGESGGPLVPGGLLSVTAGSVAYIWGANQRGGAREDMETLERLRPTVKSPASLNVAQSAGGRRLAFRYSIAW